MLEGNGPAIVTVTLEDRADRGLFVYSDDLPGLILSGQNAEDVCRQIVPAIRALFEFSGTKVEVREEGAIAARLALKSPRTVDLHVQRTFEPHVQRYIVERSAVPA